MEIPELVATLDSFTAQFGPYHPQTITIVNRLAIAFWCAGDINQAVELLDQALEGLASSPEREHEVRRDLLSTLAEIRVEQAQLEQASVIYREILEICVCRSGENHPSSLAAKGDLALVLFELGENDEAAQLERQACESAQTHLGTTHPVSCVLAWNRALRYQDCGDADFARTIVVKELAWLLTADDVGLGADQQAIRAMLAKRLNWDAARIC